MLSQRLKRGGVSQRVARKCLRLIVCVRVAPHGGEKMSLERLPPSDSAGKKKTEKKYMQAFYKENICQRSHQLLIFMKIFSSGVK